MTKILLVEDDKSLREIYGVRLLAEGYDIVSAGDGEEALAMAIKDRPSLIVSDVMMPKISGFDMLDILRSTTETKDIKVIMMTALSSEEQRQRGVSLGADRYLVKSQVGIEDVVRTVHEVLADAPVAGQTPLVTPAAPVQPPTTPITAGPGARPATPAPSPTAPFMPTAAPLAPPVAPPQPVQPVAQPTMPSPQVSPQMPSPAPQPEAAPVAPTEPMIQPQSTLPQPTAPFSTPRVGALADRVIQPLTTVSTSTPDFSSLIDEELSGKAPTAPVAPAPIQPQQPQPSPVAAQEPAQPTPFAPGPTPAQPAVDTPSMPSGINFEETPRSAPLPPTPGV